MKPFNHISNKLRGAVRPLRTFAVATLALTLLAPALAGCRKEEPIDPNKPLIYTSFFPVQSIVKTVVGDTADVRSILPLNQDPHLWEPGPRDLERLSHATALVVNGANLEHWLQSVSKSLPNLPILKLSDSIELITYKGEAAVGDFQYLAKQPAEANKPYKFDFGHTHEAVMRVAWMRKQENESLDALIARGKKVMSDSKGTIVAQNETISVEPDKVYALEMGHESGQIYYQFPEGGDWIFLSDRVSEPLLPYTLVDKATGDPLDNIEDLRNVSTSGLDHITYDPHSWLSLSNAKRYMAAIQDYFTKLFPDNADTYRVNKLQGVAALSKLEYKYKALFKPLLAREFIVTHYAWAYLSEDFGLKQYPLQGLTSMEAPSLKTIRKAIETSERVGVKTIFYEQGLETKGADTLAAEIGGHAVGLTSMEYIHMPKEGEEPLTYLSIQADNLEKLYQALVESNNNLSPNYRKILEEKRAKQGKS